jgi:protein SCO1/2
VLRSLIVSHWSVDDEAAARPMAGTFRAFAPPPDSPDYVVDHSSFIYLVDETGKYIGSFPPGTSANRMVEVIKPRLPASASMR